MKQFFKGFNIGQRQFGENISIIVNSVLLTFVYFVGVGPTSVVAKIFRKNFLELDIDKKSKSYWSKLNLENKSIDDYYRQF